ncbi:MAG: GNAT family N-acetyltransferase [Bacteroidaceae bacterium]|nr:GNAT family N-acetyltransferase [Bacteroidaceae bacterium]MBR5890645.1 GNAT family N-acetyltransferase [Bacteroidaceae bacterium]
MNIVRYKNELRTEWDSFVKKAKNSTFLFMRDYIDYHADRFFDCSLMFYNDGELRALLPANYDAERRTATSHGGLTYGGLILSTDNRGDEVLAMLKAAIEYMKNKCGAEKFIYKPLPHIYSSHPSQEDLYALFRLNARIAARSLSSTIDNHVPVEYSELRRRKIKKAVKEGITYSECDDWGGYWEILSGVLTSSHGCKPVHTLEEIELLHSRFPENIKLHTAHKQGAMVAGCVVYDTGRVAHLQYIAASPEGKAMGALDGLFAHLFENVYKDRKYIDFGISTEDGGNHLNEGLLFQKEGFGGRGIVYDVYEIDL